MNLEDDKYHVTKPRDAYNLNHDAPKKYRSVEKDSSSRRATWYYRAESCGMANIWNGQWMRERARHQAMSQLCTIGTHYHLNWAKLPT